LGERENDAQSCLHSPMERERMMRRVYSLLPVSLGETGITRRVLSLSPCVKDGHNEACLSSILWEKQGEMRRREVSRSPL